MYSSLLVFCALVATSSATALPSDKPGPVTVRWLDSDQARTFAVQGQDYQVAVDTGPARVAGLSVAGHPVLGKGGIAFALRDQAGSIWQVAPLEAHLRWKVWRGRSWRQPTDARARMNVWSAGPYYWDAHLLDIPLMRESDLEALRPRPAGPPLVQWDFTRDEHGWEALHDCKLRAVSGRGLEIEIVGGDPYLQSPPIKVAGPVLVRVRMESEQPGTAALYWADSEHAGYTSKALATFGVSGDGQQHEYTVVIEPEGRMTRLRLDPPGTTGKVLVRSLGLEPVSKPAGTILPPVRGEAIFHAYAHKMHLELRFGHPAGVPALRAAELHFDAQGGQVRQVEGRPVLLLGPVAILGPRGSDFDLQTGVWRAPLKGKRPGAVWVVRPRAEGADPAELFAPELHPLSAKAVSVKGGRWLGYDEASGLYLAEVAAKAGVLNFESAYRNPLRRLEMGLEVNNDGRPRELLVKALSPVGGLEAAVLTDPYGFPRPVPVQVSKNFGGEREEPDDTPFGDAYFPLALRPHERSSDRVIFLVQNWGIHPLKQVSSIRFFHIYWHLSTGASESTCFSHDAMRVDNVIFRIPDFRPLSGPMWPSQPQHHCMQWPGFLQYNGTRGRLIYEDTVFESVSPCLARFTMHYHLSDGTGRASVQVMEIPQRDEMRTFLKLRYRWDKRCTIKGDARRAFRWLNLWEKELPAQILWTGTDGKTHARQPASQQRGRPLLLGEPLATETPFVASHGQKHGIGCVVLLRSLRAKLGGRALDHAAVSAQFSERNGSFWLTVPREQLTLQPGDYLEADIMLMPHGEPSPPGFKAKRERRSYGLQPPRVSRCVVGKKLADFPPTLRAEQEVAAFTVEGGHGDLPIIVEGFRGWKVPLLWQGEIWQDPQALGGDGYQVESDGRGGYRFIFLCPHRDGQRHELMMTRASCTAGLSRVFDRNGYVVLQAPAEGEFRLKAPVFFAPGVNRLAPGAGVVDFVGQGREVREVPLDVDGAKGPVQVKVERYSPQVVELTVNGGPLTLRVGGLEAGGTYQVRQGEQTQKMTLAGSDLVLKIAQRQAKVQISSTSRAPAEQSRQKLPTRHGLAGSKTQPRPPRVEAARPGTPPSPLPVRSSWETDGCSVTGSGGPEITGTCGFVSSRLSEYQSTRRFASVIYDCKSWEREAVSEGKPPAPRHRG